MYFYDTNALLILGEKAGDKGKFYISSITLTELENIKTSRNKDEDIKYKARRVMRFLDENPDIYEVVFYSLDEKEVIDKIRLEESADNQICACAYQIQQKYPELIFISNDLCCKTIAKHIFKLNVDSIKEQREDIYKGYKVIRGTTSDINNVMDKLDLSDWAVNEYLIIENTDDNSTKEMRFDGEKFVALKLPPSKYIKGKNSLQRCALDILMNPDITIAAILGGYGSGKTYLSMRMALYHVNEKGNQSKILGIREPRGEGKEVGFLPGSLEEKTDNFFLPLVQQLDGGEFELESLKQRGMLESNIPYYLKGTTYNNTIILVDEAEDLDEKQIRLVGTRLGENSKIFLAGDYKQSVINTTDNNALIRMCNEFKGNSKFGCIYLGEDVRSVTSKMFAELFVK